MTWFPIDPIDPIDPVVRLDSLGRGIDRWHSPLQISWATNTYGGSGFGVWSLGPDTMDGTADAI